MTDLEKKIKAALEEFWDEHALIPEAGGRALWMNCSSRLNP
jgi:hypothetical protein